MKRHGKHLGDLATTQRIWHAAPAGGYAATQCLVELPSVRPGINTTQHTHILPLKSYPIPPSPVLYSSYISFSRPSLCHTISVYFKLFIDPFTDHPIIRVRILMWFSLACTLSDSYVRNKDYCFFSFSSPSSQRPRLLEIYPVMV